MTVRIDKNKVTEFYSSSIANADYTIFTFPGKVIVKDSFSRKEEYVYIPRMYCKALITLDEDAAIGLCNCSRCGYSMNPFAKYCSNCGAKSKGRELINSSETDE